MLAAIYVRVSTTDQADRGFSIPSQLEACQKRAYEVGALNVVEFIDDGYSGAELNRPALNDLRDAVKDGKISIVVCFDPDRFARNLMHQLIVTEEFEKNNCRLEFVNFEWKNTPEGRLFYSMRGAISEYEREKIKERTMRGKMQKAKSGKVVVPQTTIGLIWDKERETYFKDPERAHVVQDIMEMMAYEKMTTRQIAERLTSLGVPVPSIGTRKQRSSKWAKKTIGRIIQNPIYIGEYYYHRFVHIKRTNITGKTIKNYTERPKEEWVMIPVEPIIDRQLFEMANKQLKANRTRRHKVKSFYLLRGLMKCAKCGNTFGATTGSSGRYYRCYGASYDGGKICESGMLNADKTESEIWEVIKETLKNPERILQEVEHEQKDFEKHKEKAETKINTVDSELEKLEEKKQQILSMFRADLLTQDDVNKELLIIRKKSESLLGQKHKAENTVKVHQISKQNTSIIKKVCQDVAEHLDEISDEQKREIIELFVDEIAVTVDKTNSPNAPKTFEISGILAIKTLHTGTSIVGEVPQTYLSLDMGKGQINGLGNN